MSEAMACCFRSIIPDDVVIVVCCSIKAANHRRVSNKQTDAMQSESDV